MKRGDIYLVRNPAGDPRPRRAFVVVSRQALIDSVHSSVTCVFVGSTRRGLTTEVNIGPDEGLKSPSAIHCDTIMNLDKRQLTDYIGSLGAMKIAELNRALVVAMELH